jgi:glycosyltransferase involved in cell wall biosynthesis
VNLIHTNSAEALRIAQIFDEFGYNVDVVNYNSERVLDYNKYDVVFGFGEPFVNSFYRRRRQILTIYYGTGMHIHHQNQAALKRVKEVYERKGKWMPESGRIVDKAWSIQTTLVDAIITLGNTTTAESYRKYYDGSILTMPASFYKMMDFKDVLRQKDFGDSRQHFLWFGGAGLIHKGLDLLLEVFKNNPNLHLHVCGPIDNEPEFKACFYDELYNTGNIHTYGFVGLRSEVFNNLMKTCAFVIFPSCSEGQSTSVVNVMGNGGLLPVVTKESGIDVNEYGIEIKGCNLKDVELAVDEANCLTVDDIRDRSYSCGGYISQHNSIDMFSKAIKDVLKAILQSLGHL